MEDVYAGRNSESLTELGVTQAEQLGQEIRQWGIQAVYSSPLRRTLQTAEILNRYCKAIFIIDEDLNEIDLGKWSGLSKSEVSRRYPFQYQTWLRHPAEFNAEGIENLAEVQRRVLNSVNRFINSEQHNVAAFATHAVAVKLLALHYRRLSMDLYHEIHVPNLSVHRVAIKGQNEGEVERLK